MTWMILATAVLVAGVLAGDKTQNPVWQLVCKPLASVGFLAIAVASGAARTGYGQAVLCALALSWLGDVALIGRSKRAFLLGLGSFLLAHLAFGASFLVLGVSLLWTAASLVAFGLIATRILAWLLPHVDQKMRLPVLAYVGAIGLMVSLAVGAFGRGAGAVVPVAAVMFLVSDLAVARNRFVAPGFSNRAWGLPLYYAAQVLFALSVER